MEELIEALKIFLKYGNPEYPFHCEHDSLYVCGYEWDDITKEDQVRLEELGFFQSEDFDEGIMSYRYGSC